MQSVALIDYGSGNLRSAEKALQRAAAQSASAQVTTTDDPDVIARADRLVLPGVGAFAACMEALRGRDGVVEALTEAVHRRGAPFLGICVGMQLMASRGLEFGVAPGLDWIEGEVRRLEPADPHCKIPHMGWNALRLSRSPGPLVHVAEGAHVYFTHSFAFFPDNEGDVAAWTDHGGRFAAAVARNNMVGVQFHPEKSQGVGLKLLGDFLEWRP